MNQQISYKKIAATVLFALGFAFPSQAIVVSVSGTEQAGNQPIIDFISNNFQNVTAIHFGNYSNPANLPGDTELLIIGRKLASSDYANAANSVTFNALTIPVVALTSYVTRTNDGRWGWHNGGASGGGGIAGSETTVTASGAAVFGAAGTADWWSVTDSGSAFNSAGTGNVGQGQVLATIGGNILVAHWNAGQTNGTGAVFGGDRLLFNIPDTDGVGAAGLPDTAAGQLALRNALDTYTPLIQGVSTNQTGTTSLTVVEAESAAPLGTNFTINVLLGVTNITISPTGSGYSPGNSNRVATYSITFPKASTYQLYGHVYAGPDAFNDDSFFYAKTFGLKSPTNDADWNMINGLGAGGFTSAQDVVTSGGSAPNQIWKWVKWDTLFTVSAGSLTQTFQIGGREDGFYLDKFVFGPSDTALTVANLDSGTLPEPAYSTNTFDGPLGNAIHRFDEPLQNVNRDGENPAGLASFGDGLCGTTFSGGSQGDGTVFYLSLDGANFTTVSVLSSTVNGGFPQAGPTVSGSSFYGTTAAGGGSGVGTVFAGQTNGTIAVLHSFDTLSPDTALNVEGASPCGLLARSGGTLYGATSTGGANGKGTLFSLSTNGNNFTVLHTFGSLDANSGTNGDGVVPCDGLVLSGGTLYGTASGGGANGAGVVFSISTNGTGFTALHHFEALDSLTTTNSGGAFPVSGLVLSSNMLYGTTIAGGAGGRGILFAIDTNGSGFSVLHNFPATDPLTATNAGGASPCARLTLSGNVLYGTASAGGTGAAGTVFSLDATAPHFKTIYNFEPVTATGTNNYGAYPISPVLLLGNALFGAAFGGGPGGAGTIFSLPIPTLASVGGISEGNLTIDFVGAPNSTNVVQAADTLSATPIIWQSVSTNVADGSGRWQFMDVTVSSNRFYRAKSL